MTEMMWDCTSPFYFLVRLKCEKGERYHLTAVESTMDSEIVIIQRVALLIVSLGNKVTNNGTMFRDE